MRQTRSSTPRPESPRCAEHLGEPHELQQQPGSHGGLGTDEVAVQLLHGPIDSTGAFVGHPEHLTMHHVGDGTFEVDYRIDAAGAYGLTVRVLPRHDGLLTPVELGRATWAS